VRPNYWANYSNLGRFYIRVSRYSEAEAQYRRVIDLAPDNAFGYSSLGAIYFLTNRYDEAAAMFEKSIAVQPNYAAFSNLGTLRFSQGRYAEAARMLEGAVRLDERNSQVWGNLASAYYWAPGEREKARSAYERTLALAEAESRINPRNISLMLRMADCHSRLGHAAPARTLIEQAVRLDPQDVNLLFRIGEVFEQIGDRERALEWIRKAMDRGYPRDLAERSPGLTGLRADPRYRRR
jgi:Flp pilus assembly protein TadD